MGTTYGSNIFLFSYDASGSVVSVNFNGTEYYYLKNAQSDIVGIVDGSGNIVVEYTYDSWGKPLPITQPTVATLAGLNPFRYRGYIYDNETGLYYLQSRYYDPATGRFLNADGYVSTGQGILGNNMYAYCGNNPVNRADSTGNYWTSDIVSPEAAILQEARNFGSSLLGQYYSADAAAIAFAESIYSSSLYIRHEYAATIYAFDVNGVTMYGYIGPFAGTPHRVNIRMTVPEGTYIVAYAHTHPNSDDFSDTDKDVANNHYIDAYVVGPSLSLICYDFFTSTERHVSFISPIELTQDGRAALVSAFQTSWDDHNAEGCKFNCKGNGVIWPTP